MKLIKKVIVLSLAPALALVFFISPALTYAATSPGLGIADSFSILSGTYTNTVSGTTVNGDLGYTVGPAVAPTLNGTAHIADGTYNQAGIDQGTALVALNNQACNTNLAPGVDLATDTTHGPVGVYTPGVYCTSGAASIGTGGITLNGAGTYIFRMNGALTTVANSVVTLTGGASACNIWWTPTAATTLGANSTFAGTDIDASGITIGNLTNWTGRALAFGGTVTTSRNTISTIPICSATSATSSGNPVVTGSNGAGAGAAGALITPTLPNTGNAPNKSLLGGSVVATIIIASSSFYFVKKKYTKIA